MDRFIFHNISSTITTKMHSLYLLRKLFISLCKLAIFSIGLNANSNNLSVVETDLNSHLSQSTILSIIYAEDRRLWLITLDGISRFEGDQAKHYKIYYDDRGSLIRAKATKIIEAWDGTIIASTRESGLFKYSSYSDSFVPFKLQLTTGPVNYEISEIFYEKEIGLLVGLDNGALFNIVDFSQKSNRVLIEEESRISDIHKPNTSTVIISSESGAIHVLDLSTSRITKHETNIACGFHAPIEEVYSLGGDSLLIGSRGMGLFEINFKRNTCEQYAVKTSVTKNFSSSTIHQIVELSSSDAIVVTSDQGLFVLYKNGEEIGFTTDNSKLLNNEVISITQDDIGNSWVGTYNGVNRLIASPFRLFDRKNHDQLHSIVAIDSLPEHGSLIASYEGLLFLEKNSNTHVRIKDLFPELELRNERIMSLLVDGSSIFIGYRFSGVEIFDTKTFKTRFINTLTHPELKSNSISALLMLTSGKLVIGTYGGGLTIIDFEDDTVDLHIGSSSESLNDDRVVMLYQTFDERIWVGTELGLQILDIEAEKLRDISAFIDKGATDHNPIIWCMTETISGEIWFGSMYDGIFRESSPFIRNAGYEIEKLNDPALNTRDTIYAIEADTAENIWFSSNDGISRISNNNRVFHFGQGHGLQETEFEFGSSHRDSNGLIYFGGNHGYNRFDASQVQSTAEIPKIIFTNIDVAGEHSNGFQLPTNLQSIILSHTDHFITFEFSVLELIDPQSTRYRHKLVGFDPEWIDIDNRRSATYTNLPAGQFEFRVQAVNAAGVWNREGISMNLEMKPAPWRTWWAYTLYGLFIAMIIFIWHRIYRAYAIKNEALLHAKRMQDIADRYADDLQEQIEFQAKLSDSFHFYNKDLLAHALEGINTSLAFSLAGEDLTGERLKRRLRVLDLIQDSLYYHGEQLYANLNIFTNQLTTYLEQCYGEVARRVTVINGIPNDVMPASHAVSCAIIIAECLDNSLAHAFPATKASCFVSLALTTTTLPTEQADRIELSYQDDGVGLKAVSDFDAPESGGMTMIASAVASLNGKIGFSENARNTLLVTFQIPWARKSGSSLIGEETGQLDN